MDRAKTGFGAFIGVVIAIIVAVFSLKGCNSEIGAPADLTPPSVQTSAQPATPATPASDPATAAYGAPETTPTPTAETAGDTLARIVPAFDVVRLLPDGALTLAGTAAPQSLVTLLRDGQAIGTAVANEAGEFVLVLENALAPGEGALSLLAGEGETAVESADSIAFALPDSATGGAFLVSRISPDQPVEVLAQETLAAPEAAGATAEPAGVAGATTTPVTEPVSPAAAEPATVPATVPATAEPAAAQRPLSIEAIEMEGRRMWIAGAAAPGARLRLYRDETRVGDTIAGATGRWLLQADVPGAASTVIRVDDLGSDGAVLARAEVTHRYTPPAQEAAAPPATVTPEATSAPAAGAPAAGVSGSTPPELPAGRIIIRRGDNLWTLSRRAYGHGMRYSTIYDANRDQIRDPSLIYPGQVFELPTPSPNWGSVPGIRALERNAIGN